jgi:hypothetical protein
VRRPETRDWAFTCLSLSYLSLSEVKRTGETQGIATRRAVEGHCTFDWSGCSPLVFCHCQDDDVHGYKAYSLLSMALRQRAALIKASNISVFRAIAIPYLTTSARIAGLLPILDVVIMQQLRTRLCK